MRLLHVQAQTIVDELFPPGLSDPVDSSLDRLVIGLSQVLTFPSAPFLQFICSNLLMTSQPLTLVGWNLCLVAPAQLLPPPCPCLS